MVIAPQERMFCARALSPVRLLRRPGDRHGARRQSRRGAHDRALEAALVAGLPAWRHGSARAAVRPTGVIGKPILCCWLWDRRPAGRPWFGNTIAGLSGVKFTGRYATGASSCTLR